MLRRNRSCFPLGRCRAASGFTLLELCVVLLLIALMAGVLIPSFASALSEYKLRADSRRLALLIKIAANRAVDENRSFVLTLNAAAVELRPVGPATQSPLDENSFTLAPEQQVLVPDPKKLNAWIPADREELIFQPGDLCPVDKVRVVQGSAWIEDQFQPLTANVEDETYSIP